MAKPFIDIKMLGDKELSRALDKLPDKAQRRVIRPAMRKATKNNQAEIVQSLSGMPVKPRTGRYLIAMANPKAVKLIKARTGLVGYVILMPSREMLGIPSDTPTRKYGYYPFILEYGSDKQPAFAPIRSTVNRRQRKDIEQISRSITTGIPKQWARLAKRSTA
jgi:hypothetical protein